MTQANTPAPLEPTLNGQIIGQAERATRALFDIALAATDTPFDEWVAINLLSTNAATTVESLGDRLAAGVRIDRDTALGAIGNARARGLLDGSPELYLTEAGHARFDAITLAIAAIADRLYGDLSRDDLVVARRVLETVTQRAEAELAA